MKKNVFVLILAIFSLSTGSLSADCVNTCGSINDGKCSNLGEDPWIGCVRETDPQLVNCNQWDSLMSCKE